jgi:hypothetical protein
MMLDRYTNSDSRFNHLLVYGGYRKVVAGEQQATIYVLTSRVKAKINSCVFIDNNMKNQDIRIDLCDTVEKWIPNRVFKFYELYDKEFANFPPKLLQKKIREVTKIKISERANNYNKDFNDEQ